MHEERISRLLLISFSALFDTVGWVALYLAHKNSCHLSPEALSWKKHKKKTKEEVANPGLQRKRPVKRRWVNLANHLKVLRSSLNTTKFTTKFTRHLHKFNFTHSSHL